MNCRVFFVPSRFRTATAPAQVDKILQIDVQPGWKNGTKVTFDREGDEVPGRVPADFVFVVEEQPHDAFTRDGRDLMYRHTVSLAQAVSGFTLEITHLDGRVIPVTVDEVVSHKTQKVVKGEGMPCKSGKGNLLVCFDVAFPARLKSKEQVKFLWD